MNKPQNSNQLPENELCMLVIPKEEAIRKIKLQSASGRELQYLNINNEADYESSRSKYKIWDEQNKEILRRIVNNSDLVNSYLQQGPAFSKLVMASLEYNISNHRKQIESKLTSLLAIIARLEVFPDYIFQADIGNKSNEEITKRVFIVHGHDNAAKEELARYLVKIDLEPIILHEQPDRGQTIIEKIQSNSNVSFAIILLTPDDKGYDISKPDSISFRARQNVILELGYFIGLLGRDHVCALHKGDLELPSDFSGILWTPMDEKGAWKIKVAQEINSSGLKINLNLLL